jgi:methyltransferase
MGFTIFITFIIGQRILELMVSRKNEIWLRSKGAIEYGRSHYPLIVLLHALFLVSLVTEYLLRDNPSVNIFFLLFYLALVPVKVWTLSFLGKYWNTKIFRIYDTPPVKKGPYRYIKHPNYLIVVCEIGLIPMAFNLFYTAVVFTVLNAIMLLVRIREEDKVWQA